MTADDFRKLALGFDGAEESSHMDQPDFRVGGRIFATLASQHQGYGNLKLTLDQQARLLSEHPDHFLAIPGGWGRMGFTHVRLSAPKELVEEGLRVAWASRVEKNRPKKLRTRGESAAVREERRQLDD